MVGEVVEKIKVIQRVKVKAIVTENLKINLLKELDTLLRRTETELQHLDFRIKRTSLELEKKPSEELLIARNEFQDQKNESFEKIKEIKGSMESIKNLALGEEMVQGVVDSMVDIKIGDDWTILEYNEVLLKDNKVIEIRRAGTKCD